MSTIQPSDFPAASSAGIGPRGVSTNSLLDALRRVDANFPPAVDIVRLEAGEMLGERGVEPRNVYFPLDSVLSMLTVMSDGRAVEFATIGREGMSGIMETLTGAPGPMRLVSQVPGVAVRVPWATITELVESSTAARRLLDHYSRSLFVQAAQVAACNRLHAVEERCARWLLMTHDRVGRDEFLLTQEFLAQMLGVRRARVNVAAGILQRAGYIRYTRGRIRLTDRAGLEATACECYGVICWEYERLSSATGGER